MIYSPDFEGGIDDDDVLNVWFERTEFERDWAITLCL